MTDDIMVKWKHRGEVSCLHPKKEIQEQRQGTNMFSLKVTFELILDGGELQEEGKVYATAGRTECVQT